MLLLIARLAVEFVHLPGERLLNLGNLLVERSESGVRLDSERPAFGGGGHQDFSSSEASSASSFSSG